MDITAKHIDLKHRYWVFVFYDYEASGGLGDIVFSSDNLQKAKAEYNDRKVWMPGEAYVLDTKEMEILDKKRFV